MKRLFILLAVALLASPAAWAASSRQNRGDSLLYVGISPIGLHLPSVATRPVAAGVYLGENLLVGGEFGTADIKIENGEGEFGPFEFDAPDSEEDWRVDGSYDNLGAFVRWFPGTNSLNLLLAVHRRTWDTDFDFTIVEEGTGTRVPLSANLTAEATVGTVGLSNQWIFDFGLVIGVDWLVASALSGDSSDATIDDSSLGTFAGLVQDDKEEAQQQLEDAGDALNTVSGFPGLFVLSVGWAF